MKKKLTICAALLLCLGLFAACAPRQGAGGGGAPGEEAATPDGGESAAAPEEEEYLGTAQGMDGEVTVKVVMQGDAIASVEVLRQEETPGVADGALEKIPEEIVEENSPDVEAVSGATVTSNAIMEAVRNALAERG